MIVFRFFIPTTRVFASPIELIQTNGLRYQQKPLIEVLSSTDNDVLSSIHHHKQTTLLQFPDRQLLEYDCGKLQTLAKLLMDLEHNQHRCLIYTQMTDMLNLLERFLRLHGYSYVRIDGTMDVLQRQILVERFNNDKNIFLVILSTRTGRFSVNLTGADTIIFYDSEWNSMIDTHVRDQCQRIGQIRDVHIYRLVNIDTIEEKIFNQIPKKDFLSPGIINKECTEEQFEEMLMEFEDQPDRQAALQLIREMNTEDFDDQEQNNPIEEEEELQTFDNQVRSNFFIHTNPSFSSHLASTYRTICFTLCGNLSY